MTTTATAGGRRNDGNNCFFALLEDVLLLMRNCFLLGGEAAAEQGRIGEVDVRYFFFSRDRRSYMLLIWCWFVGVDPLLLLLLCFFVFIWDEQQRQSV